MITNGEDTAALVHESGERSEFSRVWDRRNLGSGDIRLVKPETVVAD